MNSLANPNKKGYSLAAVLIILLGMVVLRLMVPRWDTNNVLAVLSWDVLGYYLYLPAVFVHGDLSQLAFIPEIFETYDPSSSYYQAFPVENGNYLIKYTMGLSLCYLPFFLIGHLVAVLGGWPVDGFSAPYQFAIGVSPLFYAGLAFYLLRKVLLRYFTDVSVALALLVLVLGSNYVQYVCIDGAMPHGYLFAMYAAVIYLTMRWHDTPNTWIAILIGFLIGWSTLIRPTEAIMGMIPLFWGVTNWKELKEKIVLLLQYKWQVVLLVVFAFLPILPQLLYWKYISGDFIYYTYKDEGFDWMYPHFRDVLLGFRKGWLIYTPLMWLPLLGFPFLYKKAKPIFAALFLFFLLNLYVVCSWSIWWYQGSYSCRALVQSYPVLAFPLAAFFMWLVRKKLVFLLSSVLIVGLFLLNNFQLWQYNQNIIKPNGISLAYYKAIFGKTEIQKQDLVLLDTDETISDESKYNKTLIKLVDLEQDTADANVMTGEGHSGNRFYQSSNKNNFQKTISFKRSAFPADADTWLKLGIWCHTQWGNHYVSFVTSCATEDKKPIKWVGIELGKFINNGEDRWEYIHYYYKLPPPRDNDYLVEIYVYNVGETAILWDDLTIETLTPRK